METAVDAGCLDAGVGGDFVAVMDSSGREGDAVRSEVFECCFGWKEEGLQADYVGCPDHGLDVEGRPAVCCHAYKL